MANFFVVYFFSFRSSRFFLDGHSVWRFFVLFSWSKVFFVGRGMELFIVSEVRPVFSVAGGRYAFGEFSFLFFLLRRLHLQFGLCSSMGSLCA